MALTQIEEFSMDKTLLHLGIRYARVIKANVKHLLLQDMQYEFEFWNTHSINISEETGMQIAG